VLNIIKYEVSACYIRVRLSRCFLMIFVNFSIIKHRTLLSDYTYLRRLAPASVIDGTMFWSVCATFE